MNSEQLSEVGDKIKVRLIEDLGKPYQFGLLVKDLHESVESYWRNYGIGPWSIYSFERGPVQNMHVRGERKDYTAKVALTMFGPLQIELIQPIEGESIYWDYLKKKGEGLHHLCCAVDDIEETINTFVKFGFRVIQSGTFWKSGEFAYLDTEGILGIVLEICKRPREEDRPAPEEMFPHK